jgi:acetyl-CoA carboxylase biotin carboxyl carrier protein
MTDPDADDLTGAPSPERVARLVDSLAAVMHQAQVTELDLELGSLFLRMRRPSGAPAPDQEAIAPAPLLATSLQEAVHEITAPMVGTFYVSPTPSAAPYVAVGDTVSPGQTIGIIEAMKIMNEITADRGGVVQAFLAANAEPVEYGSPLIRLSLGPGDRL